ncbi:MAG: OmpA family protein [Magnetospirillum sp.]
MIAVWLFAAVLAAASSPAGATNQLPDKIIIDGAAPQDLLPYDFMKTPLWEAFRDPEMMVQWKAIANSGHCTALYRGYVATWEIKEGGLYLTKVKIGQCGQGDAVPLAELFPGSTGPIPATWFSGELVAPRANDGADIKDPISKLNEKYQFIRIDKGVVTDYRIAWPNPNYRPCGFVWCVGDRAFFPSGSSKLTPDAVRQLLRWAVWMKRFPQDVMTIEGHADANEKNAQRLSEERARNAKQYLMKQGVEEHRLKVVAYGNSRALGDTEAEFAHNRSAVAILDLPPQ